MESESLNVVHTLEQTSVQQWGGCTRVMQLNASRSMKCYNKLCSCSYYPKNAN